MRQLILFVFAFLLLAAPPAFADIDAAGADALKKAVESSMAYETNSAKFEGQGIRMNGPIEVTPKGKFYEVRLPGLVFQHEAGRFDIGTVVINAVPTKDGGYLTSMALPSPMKFFDTENKALFEIAIGSQRFAGAWYPALQAYTKMDSEYKNIVIRDVKDGELTASLAGLKVITNLTENSNKTWSGPTTAEATGFKLEAKGKSVKSAIVVFDRAVSKMVIDQINLLKAKEANDKLVAFFNGKKEADLKAEDFKQFSDVFLKEIAQVLNGEENSFEITNVDIGVLPADTAADPKTGTPAKKGEPFTIKLAKFTSGFSAKNLLQEKGSAGLRLGAQGFNFSGADKALVGLIPTAMNFDIAFDNLPMKSLGGLFSELFNQAIDGTIAEAADKGGKSADTQKREQLLAQTMLTLPGILSNAGATVSVRNTYIQAPEMVSMLSGKMIAKPGATAVVPLEGTLTLNISGLDEVVAKYAQNPQVGQYVQPLAVVQMMGQPGKAANGKSMRNYVFEITPDGRMLLNGGDVGAMGAMLQGGAPGQ